jgi:hypothetical protein
VEASTLTGAPRTAPTNRRMARAQKSMGTGSRAAALTRSRASHLNRGEPRNPLARVTARMGRVNGRCASRRSKPVVRMRRENLANMERSNMARPESLREPESRAERESLPEPEIHRDRGTRREPGSQRELESQGPANQGHAKQDLGS